MDEYRKLTKLLIARNQELKEQVRELQKEVEILKEAISSLKEELKYKTDILAERTYNDLSHHIRDW